MLPILKETAKAHESYDGREAEMRDVYAVGKEDKDFAAWKDGFRRDPADPDSWWRPWLPLIQEVTARRAGAAGPDRVRAGE